MSAIEAIGSVGQAPDVAALPPSEVIDPSTVATPAPEVSFTDMIAQGIENIEAKVDTANAQVREFAVDDTVPIHQVTIALEEARLAVELAMQVRTRLVEGYREIMNMQL